MGIITDPLSGFLALESIPSRDMGGFMLNFILGVVCVSLVLANRYPFGAGPSVGHAR